MGLHKGRAEPNEGRRDVHYMMEDGWSRNSQAFANLLALVLRYSLAGEWKTAIQHVVYRPLKIQMCAHLRFEITTLVLSGMALGSCPLGQRVKSWCRRSWAAHAMAALATRSLYTVPNRRLRRNHFGNPSQRE